MVERRRRLLSQRLVGPLVVVELAEAIETRLLRLVIFRGRPGGLIFQGPVHPLVASVLLGVGRLDEFGEDAQADPPDGEARQCDRFSPCLRGSPSYRGHGPTRRSSTPGRTDPRSSTR